MLSSTSGVIGKSLSIKISLLGYNFALNLFFLILINAGEVRHNIQIFSHVILRSPISVAAQSKSWVCRSAVARLADLRLWIPQGTVGCTGRDVSGRADLSLWWWSFPECVCVCVFQYLWSDATITLYIRYTMSRKDRQVKKERFSFFVSHAVN